MTKENLLELCRILKENKVNVASKINEIRSLSDKDIETIRKSTHPVEMFDLLLNNDFHSLGLDEETRNQVIECINNSSKAAVHYTYLTATSSALKLHGRNYLNLVKLVSESVGKCQPYYAYQVIQANANTGSISTNELDEIVKIISKFKDDTIVSQVASAACSWKVIATDYALDVIRIIAKSRGSEQAKYSLHIAKDEELQSASKKTFLQMVRLVADEKSPYISNLMYRVLLSKDGLKTSDKLKAAKIIKKSKGVDQASYATDMVMDDGVRDYKLVLELASIVSQAEEVCLSYYANIVATSFDVLNSGHAIELTDIVSKSTGEYQADYAKSIATDEFIIRSDFAIELTKIASTIEEGQKIKLPLETLELIISEAKNKVEMEEYLADPSDLYDLFEVQDYFWRVFKEDSDYALQLLDESITDDKEDIKAGTKIRIRKKEEPKEDNETE